MKPYTLEWWIHQLQDTQYYKRTNQEAGKQNIAFRYLRLEYWIRDRIIEKYGEDAT